MQIPNSYDQTSNNQITKNEGFKLLKVKYDPNSTVIRNLFLKRFTLNFNKNSNNNDDKPENRTLFIINVPPVIYEHHIRYLFEKCGQILRIYFQEKPSLSTASRMYNKIQCLGKEFQKETEDISSVTEFYKHENEIVSYKVCYVVFKKSSGLSNAIKMTETDQTYHFRPNDQNSAQWYSGVKLWQKHYNDSVISPNELKKTAESFIEEYGKKFKEQDDKDMEVAEEFGEPDSQGWITVNRKLRRDRRALFNDRFHDQVIENKFKDKEIKRKIKEQEFTEQIESIIKDAVKKKKSRKSFNF